MWYCNTLCDTVTLVFMFPIKQCWVSASLSSIGILKFKYRKATNLQHFRTVEMLQKKYCCTSLSPLYVPPSHSNPLSPFPLSHSPTLWPALRLVSLQLCGRLVPNLSHLTFSNLSKDSSCRRNQKVFFLCTAPHITQTFLPARKLRCLVSCLYQ